MDYDLILCEGTCEREFIGLLLERKLLIFSRERMLGGRIFHLRQLNPMIEEEIRSLNPGDKVFIRRIGDKQNETLRRPKDSLLNAKIASIDLYETRPEFEVLFLLHEGQYEAYLRARNKQKMTLKASVFYKSLARNYNKQTSFVREYFEKMKDSELVSVLALYLRKRGREKGRKTIFDLLNEEAQALKDR